MKVGKPTASKISTKECFEHFRGIHGEDNNYFNVHYVDELIRQLRFDPGFNHLIQMDTETPDAVISCRNKNHGADLLPPE